MRLLTCLLFVILSAVPGFAQKHKRQPAGFDSYLLALSWSPEFCHGHPSDPQCTGGKHLGFVVHGLWPEYKTGSGPENCGMQPGLADPSKMLDIMPTLHLIQHEWTTHGTCTGLSADDYFALIRKAWNSIKIPAKITTATSVVTESPSQVKKDFEAANGSLTDANMTVSCTGNFLQGVDICLAKDLSVIACTAVKDCRVSSIRIPPVQ